MPRKRLPPEKTRDLTGFMCPAYNAPNFAFSRRLGRMIGVVTREAARIVYLALVSPGSEEIDLRSVVEWTDTLCNHLHEHRPAFQCMHCYHQMRRDPACECGGRGWLTMAQGEADKNHAIRLRQQERDRARFLTIIEQIEEFRRVGNHSRAAIDRLPVAARGIARQYVSFFELGSEENPDRIHVRPNRKPKAAILETPADDCGGGSCS